MMPMIDKSNLIDKSHYDWLAREVRPSLKNGDMSIIYARVIPENELFKLTRLILLRLRKIPNITIEVHSKYRFDIITVHVIDSGDHVDNCIAIRDGKRITTGSKLKSSECFDLNDPDLFPNIFKHFGINDQVS